MPGGWQPLYITRTGADLTGHLVSREDIVIDADTARVLGVEGGGRGCAEVICTSTTRTVGSRGPRGYLLPTQLRTRRDRSSVRP